MAEVLNLYSFSDAAATADMPGLERPWQSVWPPEDQDDLQRWLKTDSPEFINWRFDPSNFFNRPWSSYTRNEAAKTEQAYTILPPDDPVPAADAQNGET